ncbi:MAG: CbiX/SirB N-terminal domain-containing protein [Candidatus Omnitrophota bacterium]|nr:CbiX/SirB N-terminal domain-containing protein [Candidatus Omnitrophota bacterium]
MKAILLISHGSRAHETQEEVLRLVKSLREEAGYPILEHAFLDIESPSVPEAVASCVNQGAAEIVVLLNFLNSGKHILNDIPHLIREAREKYPQVAFKVPPHIGAHPQMPTLFLDLIKQTQ